jgi:hypothetical protein
LIAAIVPEVPGNWRAAPPAPPGAVLPPGAAVVGVDADEEVPQAARATPAIPSPEMTSARRSRGERPGPVGPVVGAGEVGGLSMIAVLVSFVGL